MTLVPKDKGSLLSDLWSKKLFEPETAWEKFTNWPKPKSSLTMNPDDFKKEYLSNVEFDSAVKPLMPIYEHQTLGERIQKPISPVGLKVPIYVRHGEGEDLSLFGFYSDLDVSRNIQRGHDAKILLAGIDDNTFGSTQSTVFSSDYKTIYKATTILIKACKRRISHITRGYKSDLVLMMDYDIHVLVEKHYDPGRGSNYHSWTWFGGKIYPENREIVFDMANFTPV